MSQRLEKLGALLMNIARVGFDIVSRLLNLLALQVHLLHIALCLYSIYRHQTEPIGKLDKVVLIYFLALLHQVNLEFVFD